MANVSLQTYGCSLNQSDSEVMAGILVARGHELVHEERADILVINSCTVKSNPEQRLFHQLRTRTKPVVVAGCAPQADPHNEHFANVSVICPKALSRIADAVEQTLQGRKVTILDDVDGDRNALPCIPSRKHVAIIPTNAGCLNHCSYCKTKHARGHLQSYPPGSIEKQFRAAVNNGAKEVWLTSQDTAAYGLDINTDITALLERLLRKPGDYRIRLGMANPQHLAPRIDRLISVLRHPNMFKFLHLPVQSGSDDVLKNMRRGYTTTAFKELVRRITRAIPNITIATDIIVGFPTETEADFHATEGLIHELKIPIINLSKFSPRPGTAAANMKPLSTKVVKQRSTRLKALCVRVAAQHRQQYVGRELSVLIDEHGKHDTLIGKADNYLQVILPRTAGTMGDRVIVTPSRAGIFDVRAV
ncbi:tRNA (N(6)-L-threonylcarbamoyladenosine(37)-C(2))-methylthiotransferase [Candidatus Woesearchaeota archaeon]|nr:tRNA (N(6)-L-threonylcarbamoyladenosine(37)-C(2))-methylthiotransferase [Candidatus Woesearchaeota archaeon]